MALQDSTFKTAHVLDNEIIKASDFEFAFEQLVENVSKSTQMILESNQDFVINGKVLPYDGMNVQISPIYGVCKSTGKPFGRTETAVMEYGFAISENGGRVDIIEVQGQWETFDSQQRAFNDPDTDTQTYQYVDTKKLLRPVYQIKQGTEGSSIAPEVDAGWVKLAEVVIRDGANSITESDIKNITADVAGMNNTGWTTQPAITYNIGYISDVNARFRMQHNEDGTHKDNVIDTDSLSIGTGAKQVNGNALPIGGVVSIPTETITASDTILSVVTKAAAMITSLYNSYLKFGEYGFKAVNGLSISAIADGSNVLTKPINFYAAGDGTAVIKIDNNAVLSIDAQGKLSTNGYTASNNNHLVTKAVTDAISTALTNLTTRVTNLEQQEDQTEYANGAISLGNEGRFVYDDLTIQYATTTNIQILGNPEIDGNQVQTGDVVLVKNQTNKKENGIYEVDTQSTWQRLTDYDTPDAIIGKIFEVSAGNTNAGRMFYFPKANYSSEDFGSDNVDVLEYQGSRKPIAKRLIMRDEYGRAQVAAPSAENDIARKAEITALYGNTVGCAPGTAAVGTATTFARSDHVHPVQTCVECASKDGSGCSFGTAARCAASAFRSCTWEPTSTTCSCIIKAYCYPTLSVTPVCCAGVCITYISNCGNGQYCVSNESKYPRIVGSCHCVGSNMCCCSVLIMPGQGALLGGCWSCCSSCSGTSFRRIWIYSFSS